MSTLIHNSRRDKVTVAIVGCGVISDTYADLLASDSSVVLAACADLDRARARAAAGRWRCNEVPVHELLTDDAVDVVVNLTPAREHAGITRAALNAGRHVYSEKPLALALNEVDELIELARQRARLLASAPDTAATGLLAFAAEFIRGGGIGRVRHIHAQMTTPGHEHWHPDPEPFYSPGGGPLLDMGPYCLTAVAAIAGPAASARGLSVADVAPRTLRVGDRHGTAIKVTVPTQFAGLLAMRSGATASIVLSYQTSFTERNEVIVYGDDGVMRTPSPDVYGGRVELWDDVADVWRVVRDFGPEGRNARGLGVLDLADALRAGLTEVPGQIAVHEGLRMLFALEAAAAGGPD